MITLGQVLADRSVRVDRFTPLTGEDGQTFRRVVLHTSSAEAAKRTEATFDAMSTAFSARVGRT